MTPTPKEVRDKERAASTGDAAGRRKDREAGSTSAAILPEGEESAYGEKGQLKAEPSRDAARHGPRGPFPREDTEAQGSIERDRNRTVKSGREE